jgi:hypothetical protein
MTSFMKWLMVISVVCCSIASAEIVTFQNELNGYTGCSDTYLWGNDSANANKNYGSRKVPKLSRTLSHCKI